VYVQSFSVSAQEATPTGIFFSPDGINMYIVGATGDEVNQYLLSTAWNISTASFVRLFSVSAQDTSPQGLFFKPDGTKMYIVGATGDDVNEYDLSIAWNISTASFIQLFSVAAQDTTPTGVSFKNDGTKMYIIGSISDSVHEYTLGTAWNISTAVYLQSFSVAAQSITPTDISFTNDGTQMYIIGSDDDRVYKYTLGTAWDISTAVYLQSFSVVAQESSPQGLFVKSDSTEMYIVGDTGDAIYEYTFIYPNIAVTTFNDTQQQYLNTQVITASTAQTVLAIQSISNEISLPLATTRATASTAGGTSQITVDSTSGFIVNATVQCQV
jgi:DNA-binding beta-propeller fold protein YncE